MKINRTKNVVRNITWGYVYKITNMIFPFMFRTVMIKVLGAEYLGVNSLFTSVLQVLNLSELGFGTAMVFSMYKPIAESNDASICALLNLYKKIYFIVGTVILVSGISILPFIRHLIRGEYPSNINIYFVYLMFLLNAAASYFLFSYKGALLCAFQRNDVESKILSAVTIGRYTLETIGIVITQNYYLFLYVELISTIFISVCRFLVASRMYPNYIPKGVVEDSERKDIKNNVKALMCHKIGGIVLNSADNIVLSAFMGVVAVAKYANYYYVISAVSSIVMMIFSSMTAGIGNSFVIENVKKNRDLFVRVLFLNSWLVSWCSTCLVCMYQDFIELWVGKQYMFEDTTMILFVVYFYVHCIRRTIITFRDGAGMWRDNQWQPIASATFNLIVNIILVNIIGVKGVLISSIVSMVIVDIPWESKAFCRKIEMRWIEYIALLIEYFLIAIVVSLILYYFTKLIDTNLVINICIKGLICALVPNFILGIVFRRTSEFSYYLNLFIRLARGNR